MDEPVPLPMLFQILTLSLVTGNRRTLIRDRIFSCKQIGGNHKAPG